MSTVPAPRSETGPVELADLLTALAARDAVLHDPDRLVAVAELLLEHPGVEEVVADLLATAAARLGTDTALLSVLLDEVHLVAGAHGLSGWLVEARAFPSDWSFCAQTVRQGAVHLLPDAAEHPRWADNPLVAVDGVRTYAGAPLLSGGRAVGALCVLGGEPRAWTPEDGEVLAGLAAEAVRRLEQARDERVAGAVAG